MTELCLSTWIVTAWIILAVIDNTSSGLQPKEDFGICSEYEFTCNSGNCVPISWRCDKEIDCDDGSDEIECVVGCKLPSEFPNGNVIYGNPADSKTLDVAPDDHILRFRCDTGYEIAGPKFVQCNHGEWSQIFPQCIPLHCESPPDVTNGIYRLVKEMNRRPVIGSQAIYSCLKGFVMKNGTAFHLTCKLEGLAAVWSGEIPVCQEKDICSDPGSPPDGNTEGNCCGKGAVLKFSCRQGFELIGLAEIECMSGGTWSAPRPRCKPPGVICPDLPVKISNGILKSHVRGDFFKPLDEVTVVCNKGYYIPSSSDRLKCNMNGFWENVLGKCEVTLCKFPKVPLHGSIPELKDIDARIFPEEFEITYMCNSGYTLIGSNRNTCSKGRWKFDTPKCNVIRCYDPGTPEHGWRQGSSFEFGAKVVYSCFSGYALIGSVQRHCLDNGEWSGELTRCNSENNYCPDPGIPINGMKTGNVYNECSIVEYRCNTGFFLAGNDIRVCQKNHTWTGIEPKCIENNICPNPGSSPDGDTVGNCCAVGDHLKFSCKDGFELVGQAEIECLAGGKWSAPRGRCKPPGVKCPDLLEKIPNGILQSDAKSDFFRPGDTVNVMCNNGYSIRSGSEKIQCSGDGLWNNPLSECEVSEASATQKTVDFASSTTATPALPVFSNRNDDSRRIVLYFMFDTSRSIGYRNFNKSIQFAKALVKKVGVSEDGTRVGALSFNSNISDHFLPVDLTTTESVLDALDQILYECGGVHINYVFEKIKTEMIPISIEILGNNLKHVIFLLTDGKSNIGDDSQIMANDLKKQGVEIYCIGITGRNRDDVLYKIAPKEENVFLLHHYTTMSFLIQEITDEAVAYSKCGLTVEARLGQTEGYGSPDREHITGTARWPWMAALFYETKNGPPELRFRCGGSVIGNQWILTAAHCLIDMRNKNTVLDINSVIVKLGLDYLKYESINMLIFRPKEFIIHEKFDIATFDYDIGLIKVDGIIEFSEYILPICLPPVELPGETYLNELRGNASAIGWGDDRTHRGRGFRLSTKLREVILPIQSDETCVESLLSTKFHSTNRMLCAGDGMGTADVCQGDAGGPLMLKRGSTRRNSYWVQVGIISWGIGCRQMNTYGFYTRVNVLRDWIEQKMSST